jgi:hypothetical protein
LEITDRKRHAMSWGAPRNPVRAGVHSSRRMNWRPESGRAVAVLHVPAITFCGLGAPVYRAAAV